MKRPPSLTEAHFVEEQVNFEHDVQWDAVSLLEPDSSASDSAVDCAVLFLQLSRAEGCSFVDKLHDSSKGRTSNFKCQIFYSLWSVVNRKALLSYKLQTKQWKCDECRLCTKACFCKGCLEIGMPLWYKTYIVKIVRELVLLACNEDDTFCCNNIACRAACHPVNSKRFETFEAVTVRRVSCLWKRKIYRKEKGSSEPKSSMLLVYEYILKMASKKKGGVLVR